MTIAIACVMVAAALPILCAGIAKAGFRDYDNRHPREWLARQHGFRARANAAQANSWEAFPIFAAAVLAAQQMSAPQDRVDMLAIAFVVARLLYVAFYIADRPTLRSLSWIAGFGLCAALFLSGS